MLVQAGEISSAFLTERSIIRDQSHFHSIEESACMKAFVVLAGGLSLLTKMRNSLINDELKKHIDDICAMITENPSINETHDVSLSNAHKGVDASSYFNCCGSASVTLTSSYSSQTRKVSFNLSVTRGNSSTSDGSRFSSCYSSDFFHRKFMYSGRINHALYVFLK
ncbi:unnamed protein product [Trichobilharzia regenti]|nr:unnamed protein product [Trichobilharzia regenti]